MRENDMRPTFKTSPPLRLSDVRRGQYATVCGFAPDFPAARQAHLMAYGLTPGAQVRVVQHSPVTVVQVENLEIALERSLAEGIRIG
ncbi:MAG: ferrous iron transport protein A [Anaerolineae bacterium]|nr:MAG: ferrous iron transport protein A [Anaerolineae bacterium]